MIAISRLVAGVLPNDLELQFKHSLQQEEEGMPYITTYKRKGMQQGSIQTG